MHATLQLALGLVLIVALTPLGAAQSPLDQSGAAVRGEGCMRQCAPQADDVNGPETQTGDASITTILYGHFEDNLQRAPLNTQPPGEQEPDITGSYLTPTVKTNPPAEEGRVHFDNMWWHGFSSPGFVEIVDGQWRVHEEPGFAEEIRLVGDEILVYFYVSAYPAPGTLPVGDAVADTAPQVGIFARLESGRHPLSKNSIVFAEGDTAADDLASLPTGSARATLVSLPNQPNVWEFAVPMKILVPTIPSVWQGSEGFILSVNVFQLKGRDALDGYAASQRDLRVHFGPATPARMVMEVANPLMTKSSQMTVFRDELFIRWSFVSPFGTYDVDDRTMKIAIEGPTNVDPADLKLVIMKRSVDHDGHFKPVNATWRWDPRKADLADGEYTVKMSILNLQHTYVLENEMRFTVLDGRIADVSSVGQPSEDGGGSASPGQPGDDAPGWGVVAAVSAVAVATLHRKRGA